MKPSISLYLRVALIIVGSLPFISFCNVTVYVTNKMPFSFTPTFGQTGPKQLAEKEWNRNAAVIEDKTIKQKLCDFSCDNGVTDNHLWEYLAASEFADKLAFGQHIVKKGLTFNMEFTIGGQDKWTSNDWYYWDNYRAVSLKSIAGNVIPLEIRCRKISEFLHGDCEDLEYVISKPLNKYVEYPELPFIDQNSISILSYNTYLMTEKSMELYKFITWMVPSLKELEKPGVLMRSKLLPEAIGPDFDVLALSEVWDSDARFNLLTGLKKYGYRYATCILGSGFMAEWSKHSPIEIGERIKEALRMIEEKTDTSLEQPWIIDFYDPRFGNDKTYTIGAKGTFPGGVDIYLATKGPGFIGNGGVIIVSKWPIKQVREWIFKESSPSDKYAKKGALYAKINKKGKLYNIIATHTAGAINVPSIAAFADTLKIPANEPLLMAGDWNTNFFENRTGLAQLKSTIPAWVGSKVTADCETNALKLWDTANFTIDFILYSNQHVIPSASWVMVRKITSQIPWSDDKYPYAKEKPIRNVYDLSDHYGLVGLFTCY